MRITEVSGVLSPGKCDSWIRLALEGNAWVASNISATNAAFSRSQTRIPLEVDALFSVIQPFVPESFDSRRVIGLLAQQTRCFRYQTGEYFGLHTDAPSKGADYQTEFVVLIYLNDDFEGGETLFPELDRTVKPEKGKLLIFSPALRHSANAVARGTKYILRSELIYQFANAD